MPEPPRGRARDVGGMPEPPGGRARDIGGMPEPSGQCELTPTRILQSDTYITNTYLDSSMLLPCISVLLYLKLSRGSEVLHDRLSVVNVCISKSSQDINQNIAVTEQVRHPTSTMTSKDNCCHLPVTLQILAKYQISCLVFCLT